MFRWLGRLAHVSHGWLRMWLPRRSLGSRVADARHPRGGRLPSMLRQFFLQDVCIMLEPRLLPDDNLKSIQWSKAFSDHHGPGGIRQGTSVPGTSYGSRLPGWPLRCATNFARCVANRATDRPDLTLRLPSFRVGSCEVIRRLDGLHRVDGFDSRQNLRRTRTRRDDGCRGPRRASGVASAQPL